MTSKEVIEEIYNDGWNKDLVKIEEVTGGIKVKGSLTPLNFADMKMRFGEFGYIYNKETKLFEKDSGKQ